MRSPESGCLRSARPAGALLRKEGLYSSHLVTWRRQREDGLTPKKRGRKSTPVDPHLKKLATRPNEVWSWDITKLLGPAKWTYLYLYVILDIFSRYVALGIIARDLLISPQSSATPTRR